jgi:N-acetyl-beta-hexosaminidase
MYFDFYQADPKTQPAAIGGFTPVKQVYSYNPMPAELNETEGKHILGVQANTWTEYMPNADHVEYMVFPRPACFGRSGLDTAGVTYLGRL